MDEKDFVVILKQLKLVTQELTLQIAARYPDVTVDQIKTHNLIVRRALDTIQMYEEQVNVFDN
jgi:hypothetical protein